MNTEPDRATRRWRVSEFVSVWWRNGSIELLSAATGALFSVRDSGILDVLNAFAEPRDERDALSELDVAPEVAWTLIDELSAAGILVSLSSDADPTATALSWWEPRDLMFHRCSRSGGATGRLHGKRDAPPPVAPARAGAIALPRGGAIPHREFGEVLAARRSRRTFSHAPVSLAQLSGFLWLSARERGPADGARSTSGARPYPSGGGCYSLEIYLALGAGAVTTLGSGIYHYHPVDHALEIISAASEDAAMFLRRAALSAGATELPPVVVLMTTRFGRQSHTYEGIAYSLVLKEVGGLMQTFYCVGEYLGLASCALGGGVGSERLSELCGRADLDEPIVGELMLGGRRS